MTTFKIVDHFDGVIGRYHGGINEAKAMLAQWRADGETIYVSPPDEDGDVFLNLICKADGMPADIFAVVMGVGQTGGAQA